MRAVRFYLSVLRDIPSVARSKTELVMFWIVIAVAAAGVFWPEMARKVDEATVRTASLCVLGISVGQAALRSNYAKYRTLEKRLALAEGALSGQREHKAIRTALGNYMAAFATIQQQCIERRRPVAEIGGELEYHTTWARTFVHQFFDGGEAALMHPTESPKMDAFAKGLAKAGHQDYAACYLSAQTQSNALKHLIESIRPSVSHTATPSRSRDE